MQRLLPGTVVFLMAMAWPIHAKDNLPYTTYSASADLRPFARRRYGADPRFRAHAQGN